MWSRYKENALKRSRSVAEELAAVPVPNARARVVEEEPGERLVLAVEQKYPWPVNRLAGLLGLRRERRFELDGIGLVIYRMFDGERTAGEVVDWLMREHALAFFEARALFARYLQLLMERGLVVLVTKGSVSSSTSPA